LTGDWIVEKINNPEKIKIVKIDVEGAELLVLRGFKNFLSSFNPFIVVEVGDFYKRFGYTLNDVLAFMKYLGYEPTYILDDYGSYRVFIYSDMISRSGEIVFRKLK